MLDVELGIELEVDIRLEDVMEGITAEVWRDTETFCTLEGYAVTGTVTVIVV